MGMTGLVLVWAAVSLGATPEEFTHDFRSQALPPTLRLVGPEAERYVRLESQGLRVSLPADRKDLVAPVGLATVFGMRGNFEITAAYEVLKAEEPDTGFGVGVNLRVKEVEPSPEAAMVAWLVRAKGQQVAAWDWSKVGPGGKLKPEGKAVPSTARVGRLRLQRVGDALRFLIASDTSGETFQELHQCDFGRDDLERAYLTVLTSRAPRAVEVRWLELQIRADGLPGLTPSTGGPSMAWLVGGWSAIVLLVGGGWLVWRRTRKARK